MTVDSEVAGYRARRLKRQERHADAAGVEEFSLSTIEGAAVAPPAAVPSEVALPPLGAVLDRSSVFALSTDTEEPADAPFPSLTMAGNPLLEYLPAVDLATGRLLGFEALVRWDHPTKGRISPDVLIPWAEENGLIVDLSSWVVRTACEQAQMWSSGLQLSVNCSMVQLQRGAASSAIRNALETTGLNPDRLTIEVTERTIADEIAAADLRAIAAIGVHLAVDDVGTSWSSLQSLRRYAIEIVKIDSAFISSLESDGGMNRAIVEAIIHVSHSLAMTSVAEGVETQEQVSILKEFRADVGQGYFFSRPISSTRACELASDPVTVFSLAEGGPIDRTNGRPFTVITNTGDDTVALVPGVVATTSVADIGLQVAPSAATVVPAELDAMADAIAQALGTLETTIPDAGVIVVDGADGLDAGSGAPTSLA